MNKNNLFLIGLAIFISLGAGVYLISGRNSTEEGSMMNTDFQNPREQVDNSMDRKMVVQKDESPEMMAPKSNTIVDIAVSDDNFSTLVTAVKEAGLVETLSSDGPFTVFAPTNEAFAKIPEATLSEILADKEQLAAILTYHVVPGKVMSSDVVNLSSAQTAQGSELSIKVSGNNVMVNNANVVAVDIDADNGVIHVIDTVLIPQ